ncbi:hypothetical protein AWB80_06633 [Caballeronia pedi]|uniref:Tox-REase-5 domain-containing protein n=2 Tax=Caballeronia pedi TaxID=1777141 RepID=A0A158DBV8_9BURK|nr:hypothetical protein AWB80_06633 [Caballeronia pedi]
MGPVNHSMPQLSAQYQQYVTGFPRGMEWIYMNKDFDGFQSSQCLLQEAKANYEFFFENNGKPNFMFLRGKGPKNHGKVKNRPAYERTRDQARGQSDIVRSSPPAKLNWYFMQLKFYTWATAEFAENGYAITMQFKPMNINQRVLR